MNDFEFYGAIGGLLVGFFIALVLVELGVIVKGDGQHER